MGWRRHAYACGAAMVAFLALTIYGGEWGLPTAVAVVAILAAATIGYLHYRKRDVIEAVTPVTPARDDRVIPQVVKIAVIARDNGECQLRYPGICLVNREIDIDHIFPWSKGGSSKDVGNIQMGCTACNSWKSNRFADTPGGRVTREDYMRTAA